MIEKVKIKKGLNRAVTIEVTEATPFFVYKNKVILSDGNEVNNNNYELPIVINTLSNAIIEYVPNDIDKERFLITMNDGNYVYITLYKMTSINEYIKIISNKEIENKKGILYLDSGNYFETFKD